MIDLIVAASSADGGDSHRKSQFTTLVRHKLLLIHANYRVNWRIFSP